MFNASHQSTLDLNTNNNYPTEEHSETFGYPGSNARVYRIFIGGIDPKMTENDILKAISKIGPVSNFYMKKRHNNPKLNLGHGIIDTSSR
jgi:RNA recognition motif-containing protein